MSSFAGQKRLLKSVLQVVSRTFLAWVVALADSLQTPSAATHSAEQLTWYIASLRVRVGAIVSFTTWGKV